MANSTQIKSNTPTLSNSGDIIASGQRVIRAEAEALHQLADSLDTSFVATVDLLYSKTGRVVLTGIGKSAHVARKIAATLTSTGTPAHFMHAAEASHGDMGMITNQDVVLAFSNSGETKELKDLLQYCTRFAIPLVAITSNPDSMLGMAATTCLQLVKAPEACLETSAPTTSTTMMMALGDALAVALLERRGFKATDFKLFHPGGSLGAALMKVSDVMHIGESIPLIPETAAMSEALLVMTSKGFGCTGVIDRQGCLVGIITDGDLRRHMGSHLIQAKALEVMTPSPVTITTSALLSEALRLMTVGPHKVTALFVVDHSVPVGVVHIHDCLRAGLA